MTDTDSAGEPSDTQMDTDQGIKKLGRSTVPPQWYSNVAFGCHATMTAAARKM